MENNIRQFCEALEALDKLKAQALFAEVLSWQTPIQAVESLVVPALEIIGERWNDGQVALSQVYMSGRFCEELVAKVLPASDPDRKHQPRCAILTLNDYHLLGKRIVYSVMRASGFELFDYGRLDVAQTVTRARDDGVQILLVSVLMLSSALKVKELRRSLDEQGLDIKIVVGGAPFQFDPVLWREVGANAVGHRASDAVDIVQAWIGERP